MVVNLLVAQPERMVESVNRRIIRELKKARFSIWMANVWFTDNTVYDILIEKVKEGINVEAMLHRNTPLDCKEQAQIQEFIDAGGEFFLINETGHNHMLNKGFCMIDYSMVIDEEFDGKSYLEPGFSPYFMREYPEALVDHYINQYFSVKNKYSINRYS